MAAEQVHSYRNEGQKPANALRYGKRPPSEGRNYSGGNRMTLLVVILFFRLAAGGFPIPESGAEAQNPLFQVMRKR